MYEYITFEEYQLMSLYTPGNRAGLIVNLTEMRGHLTTEDKEALSVTDSCLKKLRAMSDADYEELALYPDFIDDDEEMEAAYAE